MMALMRDWAFLMFAISNFLTSLGYPIPYSFATVSIVTKMFLILSHIIFLKTG